MFEWLRRKPRTGGIPEYTAVRKKPTRGLPPQLAQLEDGDQFRTRRDAIEASLREPPRCPPPDGPLFTSFHAVGQKSVLTITLPDGSRCLPVFSTPLRAGDYARTLLSGGPAMRFLVSSPQTLVEMLGDLRRSGIEQIAPDRCPRCELFTSFGTAGIDSVDSVVGFWSIFKASELARLELYAAYARAAAQAKKFEVARDVLLETVAHVGADGPQPHLLLGQIAVVLKDRTLLDEARAFLRFLRHESWEKRLEEAVRSGAPTFENDAG